MEQFDEDIQAQDQKFNELEHFYQKFAYKTVIFDPLDRDILYEDEEDDDSAEENDSDKESNQTNQATKRDELLKKIEECTPILGLTLRLPLPNDRYTKLQEMFVTRKRVCREIIADHINQAKKLGNEYNKDVRQDETI